MRILLTSPSLRFFSLSISLADSMFSRDELRDKVAASRFLADGDLFDFLVDFLSRTLDVLLLSSTAYVLIILVIIPF